MVAVLYVLLTFAVTVLGAISGMGGGVLLKPVMDAVGTYNAGSIGVLTAAAVFAMALVSFFKNIAQHSSFSFKRAAYLSCAAVGGGIGGQTLFDLLTANFQDNLVKLVQNGVLVLIIAGVFVYMALKNRPSLKLKNPAFYLLAGLILGAASSFLGIGGGPINVALLMLFFGMDIKQGARYSLIIILFSQGAKLLTLTATTGFAAFDLSLLPYMTLAAVFGGFLGGVINLRLSKKGVKVIFDIMQVLVLAVCVYNIIRTATAL